MDPISKRFVFSWIATDVICSLLVWVLKRQQA
jgi:hypothetical protein